MTLFRLWLKALAILTIVSIALSGAMLAIAPPALPDPTPDWLNHPCVVAALEGNINYTCEWDGPLGSRISVIVYQGEVYNVLVHARGAYMMGDLWALWGRADTLTRRYVRIPHETGYYYVWTRPLQERNFSIFDKVQVAVIQYRVQPAPVEVYTNGGG